MKSLSGDRKSMLGIPRQPNASHRPGGRAQRETRDVKRRRRRVGPAPKKAEKVRSLVRGLEILELIASRSSPIGVKDIMAAMAIPRTSVYEVMRILKQRGYLTRAEKTGTFFLGRQLYELGLAYQAESQLLREAALVIRELRNEIDETVQLSVLNEQDLIVVLLREEGRRGVRINARVGNHFPINWSASGSLLASDLSDDEIRQRIAPTIRPSPTGRAPTDIMAVLREVRRFRRQGYAFKLGHVHDHVAMIAAPVRDPRGRCIAAITTATYGLGLSEARKKFLIEATQRAARNLSDRLHGG
jgi:DNA-binding IclR family transcriptional regulator